MKIHSASGAMAPPTRIWNRHFLIIVIVNALTGISSQMVMPVVSKYAVHMGASISAAAFIAALMPLAALVCRPFSGALTDAANRKILLIASTVITALSVALYIVAAGVVPLVVARTIHGFAFSFMTVGSMAFAAMHLPEDKLGEGLGYLALSQILSQAVGPALGLWLVGGLGFPACFLVSAVIGGLSPALYAPIPCPAVTRVAPQAGKRRFSLHDMLAKELLLYTVLVGLFSCGNGLITTFLALLGEQRGIANIALFFTAYSITLIAIRPLSGKLLDKKGLSIILYPAYLIFAAGLSLIGAAHVLWMVVLAGVVKSIGQGSGTPAIQAHCVKTLGTARAGVASSTCLIGQDLGNALAPILGGVIVEQYGYATLFHGYAVVLGVLGCSLYTIQRRRELQTSVLTAEKFGTAKVKTTIDIS